VADVAKRKLLSEQMKVIMLRKPRKGFRNKMIEKKKSVKKEKSRTFWWKKDRNYFCILERFSIHLV